ncbi:MAG: dephospho-CoA kinase [Clostridia bacterium]|nr:dephospho-CoA kinase [Clostridia bacterium]
MLPESSCLKQVCGAFGNDILKPDGTLDRQRLAKKAFSSKENAQLLNDITHPWIFLQVMKMCRENIDSGNKKIVFDAPLLFESRSEIMCDCVVSVTAPKEVRMQRLLKRDGLTREQLEKRMSVQQSDEFYIAKSDFVIDGSKSLEEIKSEVEFLINKEIRA